MCDYRRKGIGVVISELCCGPVWGRPVDQRVTQDSSRKDRRQSADIKMMVIRSAPFHREAPSLSDFAPAESRARACAQAVGNPWLHRSAREGRETGVPYPSNPPRACCLDNREEPRGRRGLTAPARRCSLHAPGLSRCTQVAGREHRAQRACVNTRRTPAGGPGNPHSPQCALGAGRGNRFKLECCPLLRWRGRERERGLPEVPTSALAVAVATRRAVRNAGAAAASGKPGGSAPAWSSAFVAGVPSCVPGGLAGEARSGWATGTG